MSQFHPPKLEPGQTVAILAPASPPDLQALIMGDRLLRDLGFNVKIGKYVRERTAYLAGTDQQRAEDFNEALRDPSIRAIFCARGGYGCSRIVNDLDYDAARQDPKIIIGYSDVTTLLLSFWNRIGLVTFHGPLIGSGNVSHWSYQQMFRQITQTDIPRPLPLPDDIPHLNTLRPGNAHGIFLGGCLTILSTLLGTPDSPNFTNSLLLIEEIGEAPYRIDRCLSHLKNSGAFDGVSGVMIGHFTRCFQRPEDSEPSFTIPEIISEILSDYDFPIVTNLPIGHGPHNLTLPIGCAFVIEGTAITQLESGVS